MKIYIWEDVLTNYKSGIMFAIANSVDEARELLIKECPYIPDEDLSKEPEELDLSKQVAFICWGSH